MPGTNYGQQVIHYDTYHMSWQEWLTGIFMGLLMVGVVAYTFYRSMVVFVLLLPIAGVYPFYRKKELMRKRKRELEIQFKEGILMLSASLRAGYSIENALLASKKELELLYGANGMISKEFSHMVSKMQMNNSVESVMMDFAERSGVEDVENFVEIFVVAKRSGGQLVPIIQHTVTTIQDKMLVEEEIQTLTASKQFEQKIMNMIPFLIIFYIDQTSPGFFQIMYDTWMGRILMSACLVVYLVAYTISKKILRIAL